jgi:hypothetical protein
MNIYKYILFVYTRYIQENWDDYTKIGKFLIYPAWIFRSVLVCIYSILCFPFVLAHMEIEKMDFLAISLLYKDDDIQK